jgi:hypothetical protein
MTATEKQYLMKGFFGPTYFSNTSSRSNRPGLSVAPGGASDRSDGTENSRCSDSQPVGSAQSMPKQHLKLVTPVTANRTVTPKRRPNADLRTREYLTEGEVERLMDAAKHNRWGHRDAIMILVTYRHGLRATELVDCVPCGGYSANRTPSQPTFSHLSAGRHSARRGSHASWSGRAGRPSWPSRLTPACFAMPAATSLPMTAMIPGRYKPASATATFSIR